MQMPVINAAFGLSPPNGRHRRRSNAACRGAAGLVFCPVSIGCKQGFETDMDTPFNERGVTLSRAGLSASGQMIPLRDLRAARVVMIPRKKPLPIILGLIGLFVLGAGIATGAGAALVLGAMIAVVGYLSWITQDVIYQLMVTTPDGEREVLITKDQEFADKVAALVGDAVTKHAAAAKA